MKKIFPIILVAGVGVALYFFMKKKHTENKKNAIPEPKISEKKPKFEKELFNKVLDFAVQNKDLIKPK